MPRTIGKILRKQTNKNAKYMWSVLKKPLYKANQRSPEGHELDCKLLMVIFFASECEDLIISCFTLGHNVKNISNLT